MHNEPPERYVLHGQDARATEVGRDIFSRLKKGSKLVDGSRLEEWLMNFAMRDERVKAQLFRFIDVLPVLQSNAQVNGHLREYLMPVGGRLPGPAGKALQWIPQKGWAGDAFAGVTRFSSRRMARRFIAAGNLPEAIKAISALRKRSLAFTIDLLGEAVVSETEASQYQVKYLKLVDGLADDAQNWEPVELIDQGAAGPVPRVNLSVKLSSLYSQFDPIDPAGTDANVLRRLRPILRKARERGVFVNVDMEQYAFKDATLRIFRDVLAEEEFRDWADVGIAMQAYLRDTEDDLRSLADWARERGTPVWVRLVKGAYWDYESVISAQNDWPLPVWDFKPETDANFEKLTAFLMEHRALLRPAIASHNVRSIAVALAQAEAFGVPPRGFEFQMLYGMAEPVKAALVAMGHRVRVYTPFGELLPGMAYLVRRLLENTSNESFLRAGFHDHLPEDELLMNPITALQRRLDLGGTRRKSSNHPRPDHQQMPPGPFTNEPLTDFSRATNRRAMEEALQTVARRMGGSYPLVIAGHRIDSGKWIQSINPAHKVQIVGRAASATAGQANAAVEAAREAFPAWRDTPADRRAELLFHSAEIMRRRRWELSAWEIYETAKQWREADADVAEAIDYCEYYGREILRISQKQRRDVPGEENEYFHEPRGVTVTIAPWNFPLAILCGMTAAALAAGNTVVMKPAEQSPIIAAKLMEVFYEAGFPPGVVNYLPGVGEEIGPTLVQHKDVAMIAFTGSRAVGLEIGRQAAETPAGQEQIKRVILELGGKNAVIVDDDADLDEAVHGVVASAFGYAGQKCSACSRVIVLNAIYDAFLARLIEATRSLRVGPPDDPGAFVGPMIDEEARQRILKMIGKARNELPPVYQGDLGPLSGEGFYVPPTIFADVPPKAAIAQEEIFGPVLSVMRVGDLDQALRIANGTPYALTGGIFSRTPSHIDRARREFRVGNLYINRKITGALVDRQPFGGLKLSGVGSKAGGPDYLLQFMVPRTITENTLRHGFAPAGGEATAGGGE
ncbi:MAG TPA: L-glutamate gamma-semialdehyde dehydrogenase [Tepidisphaeraceae bacterium]|jgi:RHH-type proline utilization regulon transcriptional repressor/proline dehydrogenase/delta 1-pyrroline-5-carboxylate dehydrogenase|nr:L-glutamate gamma-semialdehyde dehydrogenase [Tepidisphaeraceae bacterium]